MYSISGVALDNTARGWGVDERTKTLAEMTRDIAAAQVQGRDGVIPIGPGSVQAPVWALYVRTPIANREALIALVQSGSAVTVGSKSVGYTVAAVSVVDEVYAAGTAVMLFALRLDGVFWRTAVATSATTTVDASPVTVSGLFSGLSAPVQDALVRVKGAATGLVVTDSSGAWFSYAGTLTASQYLRFESDSGRAFVTTSATWSGGSDVSGDIDYGGPRGVFEITPKWSTDPAVRAGELTVATDTRSGAALTVRGGAAFVA